MPVGAFITRHPQYFNSKGGHRIKGIWQSKQKIIGSSKTLIIKKAIGIEIYFRL
jgi:hypothetical protein